MAVFLASKLIKAVAPGAHLLLAGTWTSCPSVGSGEVLRDLLAAGQPPAPDGFGDFFWFGCQDIEQIVGPVVDIVARRIPARSGLDPPRDMRVLCLVHRGPAGSETLTCCCKVS